MRLLVVTIGSLFVFVVSFTIVKLWGQTQTYPEYRHLMFSVSPQPIEFIKPKFENVEKDLKEKEFLFLDVVVTGDQKLIVPKRAWKQEEKPIRYSKLEEIKQDVLVLEDYKDLLRSKKIIFNIIENSAAVHENFVHNMKELGLEKGENFIVFSPYEAPIKSLKELAPAYLYGTTQPEILKILAMNSMYLIEAANIRADFIIHPLQIRKQTFFVDSLVQEFKRRNKKIIVGPIQAAEKEEAVKLNPYGLIIEE
jgi:hypothetical protein